MGIRSGNSEDVEGRYPSLDLLSLLSDESQLVPVSFPDSFFDDPKTVQGGSSNNTLTLLLANSQARMRQEGTIEKIECFKGTGSFANVTSLKVQVWRRNGSGFYDFIGESEDIQSIFTGASTGQLLTKILTNPILNVKVNDYIAVEIVSSGTASNIFQSVSGGSTQSYFITGIIGTTDIDFEAGNASNNVGAFRCHMKSPWAVYVGSSYGKSGQDGFWETSINAIDYTKMIPYIIQEKLGRSIQNNSKGGVTTASLLISETNEKVKSLNPKVVFLEVGTNDLGGPTDPIQFKIDYATFLDDLISDGRKCVCIGVAPRLTASEDNTQAREDYNTAIRDLVSQRRTNCIFVDMDNGFGQSRANVTKFNRSDILASLNSGDDVHYNDAGWSLMAKRIVEALFGDYN